MKQYGHLNPSDETRTGCPVTSKYGRTPPNKHGGVGRPQQAYGRGIFQCRFHDCLIGIQECLFLFTFGYVAMGSAMLFILWSRLLLYSAGSGVNRLFCLDLV